MKLLDNGNTATQGGCDPSSSKRSSPLAAMGRDRGRRACCIDRWREERNLWGAIRYHDCTVRGGRLARSNAQDVEGVSQIERQLRLQGMLTFILVTTGTLPCGKLTVIHPDPTTCRVKGSLMENVTQSVVRARNVRRLDTMMSRH